MLANYHTHTFRCNHAFGTEREYVETAIEAGLKTLGFADHIPYIFHGDYYSDFRMKLQETEDYVNTVLSLRREYAGQIDIRLGFEAEYYPGLFDELMAYLDQYPIEYYLLGQHFVGTEIGELYNARPSGDDSRLVRYVNQVIEAIHTGRFLYVAHPDIINHTGSAALYEEQMRRLCREIAAVGIPVEFNFLGYMDRRNYPNPRFWELAAEAGCTMVFGCDAHRPEHVCRPEAEKAGLALAERLGMQVKTELAI